MKLFNDRRLDRRKLKLDLIENKFPIFFLYFKTKFLKAFAKIISSLKLLKINKIIFLIQCLKSFCIV